ncbi:MAG: Clp protease N-terminal domain-containing protein, partial [Nitrospiria bacterium]
MRLDRLTVKAQEALQEAQRAAESRNHQHLDAEHVAWALVRQDDGVVPPLLKKVGVDLSVVRRDLDRALDRMPKVTGGGGQVYASARLEDSLTKAEAEADRLKDEYVSTEHWLVALLEIGGPVSQLFKEAGLTRDRLLAALTDIRGTQRVTDQNPEDKYQALTRYSRDLTDLARKGKLDPVIGRDEEIRRVMQVLSRRSKNNPVLIGEPGVGKTAIAEGLAQRIAHGDVPEGLKRKRVMSLDMGA